MCEIDFDEYCEVFSESWHKARKSHVCDSCSAPILAGTRYLRNFTVFQGEAGTEKMCSPCFNLRKRFAMAHKVNFSPSQLPELLSQCVDEGDGDAWKWAIALHRMNKRSIKLAEKVKSKTEIK